ncbi:MAG: hypothetical protein NZ455_17025, partial [Bacteroidia bacterium]|nr:hypothetical protein [Bacteroidia bacterium]
MHLLNHKISYLKVTKSGLENAPFSRLQKKFYPEGNLANFVSKKLVFLPIMSKYIFTLFLFIGTVLLNLSESSAASASYSKNVVAPVPQKKQQQQKLKNRIAQKLWEKKLKKYFKVQSVGAAETVVVILVAVLLIILLAALGIDVIGLVI